MLNTKLRESITEVKQKGLYRKRIVTSSSPNAIIDIAGKECLCFCNNDYLGLSSHPNVIAALQDAAQTYGVGSTSSVLITGYKRIHKQFEEEFADFVGMEKALLFSSGYLANQGAISSLVSKGDAVYQDKENHASLIDAIILSRAKSFRYTSLDGLSKSLEEADDNSKLIVTDNVFSMSGREADIAQLLSIAKKNKVWLLIDDAHGVGVMGENGKGALDHISCQSKEIILSAPLGKAFGCAGGVIAGNKDYIDNCIQHARSYMYTTGIAPALAAANLASLQVIKTDGWRREKLHSLIQQFRTGAEELNLSLLPSRTPIQSIIVGSEERAVKISEKLLTKGIWVQAIRTPTVPVQSARLRVSLTALHTVEEIDYLLEQLNECWGKK